MMIAVTLMLMLMLIIMRMLIKIMITDDEDDDLNESNHLEEEQSDLGREIKIPHFNFLLTSYFLNPEKEAEPYHYRIFSPHPLKTTAVFSRVSYNTGPLQGGNPVGQYRIEVYPEKGIKVKLTG